jgi:DUF4097 and DUF4098 domain-containing protein YvlB
MASTMQVPPPRPRRSLAGPVVLILVGIVFLLGTMGVLHWYMLGHWFAHYWPLLIIIWGIIKLIEYQQAQQSGTRPTGIGAGGVFLLIVIIFFGLLATQASRVNWDELRDHINVGDADLPWFGHSYSYDDQLAQAFPAGASLHVTSDRGAVNVTASNDDQMHVIVHKRINAESQTDADKWNTDTKPLIGVSDRIVTLSANTQGGGAHGVTNDLDISIPRKSSVTITTRKGDVSVMGRDGDVDITSQHGELSVTDINGKVTLKLDNSSARVSQVASDVSVEGKANDVSIEEVKGAVHLNGDFTETVKLAKISKAVSFKTSRTDMEFAKLDGDLNLDAGDLQASGLTGPVRLITRSKDITLSAVSGDVRLQDENGAVELRMTKPGSMQVDNHQGDIQIYLPDKAGFQVDARARNGEIQSDFNELKISNGDDQAVANGSVGGGGPRMVLNNEHGTIEIRKGSSMAEAPRSPKTPAAPGKPEEPTDN